MCGFEEIKWFRFVEANEPKWSKGNITTKPNNPFPTRLEVFKNAIALAKNKP